MPKANKHSVIARNDITALYERITPSKAVRNKYKNVCKQRRYPKPHTAKVISPNITSEELAEIQQEYQQHVADKSLLSRLLTEYRQLEDRISNPPPPLIERIAERDEYKPPAPLSKDINFHKTKILKRIKEFKPVLAVTLERLDPIFLAFEDDDEREEQGIAPRVPKATRDALWKWQQRLEEIFTNLEKDEVGHHIGNKNWRVLGGICKKIGTVSVKDSEKRLVEISNDLLSKKITIPF